VVAGEAAAVASFFDRFFGVALSAGVALVTAASALGLGLALCDRLFGVAEAAGLGVAFWEYASGEAAIANRARSERNVRIKHVFYLDLMPVGNPGSVKKGVFSPCERPPQRQIAAKPQLLAPQAEPKMLEICSLSDDKSGLGPLVLLDVYTSGFC
jgi:hypothetical protein